MSRFNRLFVSQYPVIGMIFLPPLLGYKNCPGVSAIIDKALEDLFCLQDFGIEGVLIENEFDQPHRVRALPEIIAIMSVVMREVVKAAQNIPVGVEILLNDPCASLAVAKASEGHFIRTDYFVDRMSREKYGGEMQIDPIGLMNYRQKMNADDILIFTDIQVKYAQMLETKSLSQSAREAFQAQSDALIVSGSQTGQETSDLDLLEVKNANLPIPTLIGSGLNHKNLERFLPLSSGAIVGTGLTTDGCVDRAKVELFVKTRETILKKDFLRKSNGLI